MSLFSRLKRRTETTRVKVDCVLALGDCKLSHARLNVSTSSDITRMRDRELFNAVVRRSSHTKKKNKAKSRTTGAVLGDSAGNIRFDERLIIQATLFLERKTRTLQRKEIAICVEAGTSTERAQHAKDSSASKTVAGTAQNIRQAACFVLDLSRVAQPLMDNSGAASGHKVTGGASGTNAGVVELMEVIGAVGDSESTLQLTACARLASARKGKSGKGSRKAGRRATPSWAAAGMEDRGLVTSDRADSRNCVACGSDEEGESKTGVHASKAVSEDDDGSDSDCGSDCDSGSGSGSGSAGHGGARGVGSGLSSHGDTDWGDAHHESNRTRGGQLSHTCGVTEVSACATTTAQSSGKMSAPGEAPPSIQDKRMADVRAPSEPTLEPTIQKSVTKLTAKPTSESESTPIPTLKPMSTSKPTLMPMQKPTPKPTSKTPPSSNASMETTKCAHDIASSAGQDWTMHNGEDIAVTCARNGAVVEQSFDAHNYANFVPLQSDASNSGSEVWCEDENCEDIGLTFDIEQHVRNLLTSSPSTTTIGASAEPQNRFHGQVKSPREADIAESVIGLSFPMSQDMGSNNDEKDECDRRSNKELSCEHTDIKQQEQTQQTPGTHIRAVASIATPEVQNSHQVANANTYSSLGDNVASAETRVEAVAESNDVGERIGDEGEEIEEQKAEGAETEEDEKDTACAHEIEGRGYQSNKGRGEAQLPKLALTPKLTSALKPTPKPMPNAASTPGPAPTPISASIMKSASTPKPAPTPTPTPKPAPQPTPKPTPKSATPEHMMQITSKRKSDSDIDGDGTVQSDRRCAIVEQSEVEAEEMDGHEVDIEREDKINGKIEIELNNLKEELERIRRVDESTRKDLEHKLSMLGKSKNELESRCARLQRAAQDQEAFLKQTSSQHQEELRRLQSRVDMAEQSFADMHKQYATSQEKLAESRARIDALEMTREELTAQVQLANQARVDSRAASPDEAAEQNHRNSSVAAITQDEDVDGGNDMEKVKLRAALDTEKRAAAAAQFELQRAQLEAKTCQASHRRKIKSEEAARAALESKLREAKFELERLHDRRVRNDVVAPRASSPTAVSKSSSTFSTPPSLSRASLRTPMPSVPSASPSPMLRRSIVPVSPARTAVFPPGFKTREATHTLVSASSANMATNANLNSQQQLLSELHTCNRQLEAKCAALWQAAVHDQVDAKAEAKAKVNLEHGERIRSAEQRAMALELTRDELLLRLQHTELELDALKAASSTTFATSKEKLSRLQDTNEALVAQNKALQTKCDILWEQAVTGKVAAQQHQLQQRLQQQRHMRPRLHRQHEQKLQRQAEIELRRGGEHQNVSAVGDPGLGTSPVSISPVSTAAVAPVLALSLTSARGRKAGTAKTKEGAGRAQGLWQ